MRLAVITILALLAVTPAVGQQMSYEQWAGPPLQQEENVTVTWQGVTKYGYTIYLHDASNGQNSVLWQSAPGANWRLKAADGIATLSPDLSQVYDVQEVPYNPPRRAYNAQEAPRQRLSPERYAPPAYTPPSGGYQTAGYPEMRQPSQSEQAAFMMRMFGAMVCMASRGC